jgi:hypothetical protein
VVRKRALRSVVPIAMLAVLAGVPSVEATSEAPLAHVLDPTSLVHLLPTRGVAASLAERVTLAATPSLQYWGGPVMQPRTKTIPIFWEPTKLQDGTTVTVASTYHTLIQSFLGDLGGHGLYSGLTQYYEKVGGTKKHIVNASGTGARLVITSAYPAATGPCQANGRTNCITNGQLQAKLASVIAAKGLPVNGSTLYLVFTAPGEESCVSSTACFIPILSNTSWLYCAYHSAFYRSGSTQPVIYANLPSIESTPDSVSGCSSGAGHPNDAAFDDETPALSHEISEAITDPLPAGLGPPTGWNDPVNGEVADICFLNDAAAVTWGGHTYEVAGDWSNATGSCVTGGAQSVSTAPGSGIPGSSAVLTGAGFRSGEQVTLTFVDAGGHEFSLGTTSSNGAGTFAPSVQIPAGARTGRGTLEAIGGSPDDGASASLTVLPPPFQPDGLVARAKTGPFTGNGVYSATGAQEKVIAKVVDGKSTTFWVQVQDDGSSADTIALKGPKAPAGFAVAYRVGTKDVSAALRAGTYRKHVAPGASFLLQVVVTVKPTTAAGKVVAVKVLATSAGDATKKDAVVPTVKAA